MGLVRICVCALLLFKVLDAQGRSGGYQISASDIVEWTDHADRIVIGTFREGFYFPWFDGWHNWSRIEVDENIFPRDAAAVVQVPWVSQKGCFVCDGWQPDGQKGIWFLRQGDHGMSVFGGTTWCPGSLDGRFSRSVRAAAERKERR